MEDCRICKNVWKTIATLLSLYRIFLAIDNVDAFGLVGYVCHMELFTVEGVDGRIATNKNKTPH